MQNGLSLFALCGGRKVRATQSSAPLETEGASLEIKR